jgi:hypothetical protein
MIQYATRNHARFTEEPGKERPRISRKTCDGRASLWTRLYFRLRNLERLGTQPLHSTHRLALLHRLKVHVRTHLCGELTLPSTEDRG